MARLFCKVSDPFCGSLSLCKFCLEEVRLEQARRRLELEVMTENRIRDEIELRDARRREANARALSGAIDLAVEYPRASATVFGVGLGMVIASKIAANKRGKK